MAIGFFKSAFMGAGGNAITTLASRRIQAPEGAQDVSFYLAATGIFYAIYARDIDALGFSVGLGAMAAVNASLDALGRGPANR